MTTTRTTSQGAPAVAPALARLRALRAPETALTGDDRARQPEGAQRPLVIVDLCSGLNGWTAAARERGHHVLAFDQDPKLPADVHCDVRSLTADDVRAALRARGWSERPDVIVASPPCEGFSVASCGKHWSHPAPGVYAPKSEGARIGWAVAEAVSRLVRALQPRLGYLVENPRGMMHKVGVMRDLGAPHTVWQCRYGNAAAKPTVIWSGGPLDRAFDWRPECHNGNPDHEAAERGSKSGTQGVQAHDGYSAANWRSVIARGLADCMVQAAETADRAERLAGR